MMTDHSNTAKLEKISLDHYLLKGELNFKSVPELWENNKTHLFNKSLSNRLEKLTIDCSQLERSDSSGLSLLLEWYRAAQLQKMHIVFLNPPEKMVDIARISGLDKILPLQFK